MRDQAARSAWEKKIRNRVRDKAKAKVAWKRERDAQFAPERPKEITIEEAMAAVADEAFFEDDFREHHMTTVDPDDEDAADYAIAAAIDRGQKNTLLFLGGGRYRVLADDIRSFHNKQFRNRGRILMFTTNEVYPFITVTGVPAAPVASPVQWGRIRFNMRRNPGVEADLGHRSAPVYHVYHLEDMFETGAVGEREKKAVEFSDDDIGPAYDSDDDL